MFMYKHLIKVNQTYWEHFLDAILYSWMAYKASFYFFVHSIFPDTFEFDGSIEITKLVELLREKKRRLGL